MRALRSWIHVSMLWRRIAVLLFSLEIYISNLKKLGFIFLPNNCLSYAEQTETNSWTSETTLESCDVKFLLSYFMVFIAIDASDPYEVS